MKPKVIAILGPTASGKTSLGIAIAKQFNGEVVSVDSRQVYREMNIGTAKPEGVWVEHEIEKGGSINQLFGARKMFVVDEVVHWGIDLVDPDEDYSVAQFKQYAEQKIKEIVQRGKLPILVGGTGLWLQAVIDNLDLAATPADADVRAELESRPLGDLFAEYKRLDPAGAEFIDRENKRRVVRALEVTKLTGKPFSEQRSAGEPKYDVLQIGLDVPREELYERINQRVEEMVAMGLVDEVRRLKGKYGCEIDAMTGIGYRQICEFLNGNESLAEAIQATKQATRRYAKRQMTWFKRDERIKWITPGESVDELIKTFLKK
ncbi:tRNA (adenosine(37)-N6)-dimethylallyltransferase MiaA [Candidatus Uhrbacteria bacterium CG_4_9_14_3_um_filter_50_9]|uniref:tRNA dimethylallyltransferase n=1 Tax=Candidatus Uhrbacteria bacterium CG_4_9_14_3_um_filter_50_9 TaxID=1975035 RepID=A0A2M7XBC2_9BACT|nr:MAG: tRNA (adenosine(37)-N6)-dimethylallyltransferase MiaA [Candidatus Uhrbacteria bacterium CG_4_9_14_3_um_filter_50_9]